MAFGAIPFGKGLQVVDFNLGIVYLLAVSSLGVIGVLLAGWSSNNKYSMIGAMRSGAQFISYELSAAFALMTVVVMTGTMQLSEIVENQRYVWNIFNGHLPAIVASLIYLISGHAETNRAPFDLPEAEGGAYCGIPYRVLGYAVRLFFILQNISTCLLLQL